MKYYLILFLVLLVLGGFALQHAERNTDSIRHSSTRTTLINSQGKTIESRIGLPAGFSRVKSNNGPVSYFRNLPVKPSKALVLLYNGKPKNRQDVHVAVIDMEIGKNDLQQCADVVMRLRAEYLFKKENFAAIHFNFTSGDEAAFTKYAEGYRPVFNRAGVKWQKTASRSYSHSTFRKYMDLVFSYAGTASLEKELVAVPRLKDIQPGDVFIRGGFPGHAVMVLDVAVNPTTNEKIYLLSQSYMPAQETHLIKNPENTDLSPWYSASNPGNINTPEWTFSPSQLKRFNTW